MKLNKLTKTFNILINNVIILFEVQKNTESRNPKVVWRIMLLSKCTVCDNEKLKYIKEQRASRSLNSLGIKKPLSKIPLLGPLLFYRY